MLVTSAAWTSRASRPSTCRAIVWTRPSAAARVTTSISRARRPSSSSTTKSGTWSHPSVRPSARALSRASPRPARGTARTWLLATPAIRVAEAEASFFPETDPAVLTSTIGYYQKLGCWTPHVEITRSAFEATLDVFLHAGVITKRDRYEDVVAAPPA